MARALFITGIPASGKSTLAKRLAEKIKGQHVDLDDFREMLGQEDRYKNAVNFYLNQDEKKYYTTRKCEDCWGDLVRQSETIWPALLETIHKFREKEGPLIVECVNILPHLAKRDLDFPGIVLLGNSEEEVFERLKKEPRWGKTEDLQKIEAKQFFHCEGQYYKEEAERYGYQTFHDTKDAEKYVLELFGMNERKI